MGAVWRDLLSSPCCGADLIWLSGSSGIRCSTCTRTYPVSRGVPILIDDRRSVFRVSDIVSAGGTKTEQRGFQRLLPGVSLNVAAAKNYALLKSELLTVSNTAKVLIVGAGEGGVGIDSLTSSSMEIVRSDVAISNATDICLDAHNIPFADGTFDCVVLQAVLEHVVEPSRCVAEVVRVLKPGGLVYAETPFMQQVHMGAHDFTRFTMLGHRRLFRDFSEIASGTAVGAGSALAWTLVYFCMSFTNGRWTRRVVRTFARLLFFWLKYFDLVLVNRGTATDAAGGFFFLGKQSPVPLSDDELLKTYKGGIS